MEKRIDRQRSARDWYNEEEEEEEGACCEQNVSQIFKHHFIAFRSDEFVKKDDCDKQTGTIVNNCCKV